MPAYRTRDTPARSLEVSVDAPVLNIISPTPRAFTFPIAAHTPSPSPSNSPFEPDLRPLTLTPPRKTHTPASSVSSVSSFLTPDTLLASPPAAPTHRRRRSTASDVNERRPKKGDDDYIKRPENAFILFRRKCCEDRNLALGAGDAGEGAADGPAPTPTKKQRQADLSKTISQQWKSLANEERQYWEDLAKEKKKEHELMYPHYVYRPQRVKKGKAAAGKGKGPDGDADGEGGISFILPVPAVPQRQVRRAASAPTPPLAYLQQTIQVPTLYMPSTPSSPLPMISRRTSASPAPLALQDPHLAYDFVRADGLLQPSFGAPPSWAAAPDLHNHGFPMFAGAFGDKPGVPLDPLAIPGAHGMYAQDVSPASFAPDASSGPPSPHAGPFTPTTLETIQMPADAWQQHTGLGLAPPPPSSADSSALPHTLEYQPYAWQPNMWTHGGEPLFNEDFDLSLIPPIALDVPKFDVVGERDHDATPTGGCAPQFAACDGDDGGRDPFMQGFRFDDHLMSGDGF